MPVDAAGSLPSVQLGDEAVVQLAGIIRIEMKAAAFIAAHGAVHDQGGHRHQVAQVMNLHVESKSDAKWVSKQLFCTLFVCWLRA